MQKSKSCRTALGLATTLLLSMAIPAFSQTTSTAPRDSSSGDDVSVLKQQIAEQQKQIQALQATMKAMLERLDETAGKAQPVSSKAEPASPQVPNVGQVASVTPVIPTSARSKDALNAVPASASSPSALAAAPPQGAETPNAIHFKGINITPIGFMAAETVWRDHALSADVNTPFNSVPMPGSSQYQMSEFNASGRQSRFGSLFEGKLDSAKIGGYYEADFLSAGTTSNDNQSNSYTLRQRQFWGKFALDSGWTFTGGQMWGLVTETKQGADNRSEALPMTIDAQYTIGFSWARQYGLRIAKKFNDNFWAAFAIEEAQFSPITQSGGNANWLAGQFGSSGGLYSPIANYSFDRTPDFVGKLIVQPKWGHFELFGVLDTLRDRVFPCATTASTGTCGGVTGPSAATAFNDSRTGGGIGANGRVSVINKHVDIGAHVFAGDGIGRYGTGGLPVATLRPDGTLAPLRNLQTLGTLEFHGKKLDVYSNLGAEFSARASYFNTVTSKPAGYGNPLFRNDGCTTETVPGSAVSTPTGVGGAGGFVPGSLANCTANTRDLIEATVGFWYRFYKGPKGTVQWGPQYSYVVRNTWSGVNSAGTSSFSPQGTENMFFTSLRYYLP
ncbi:MAG: hypothetical protein ABSB82_10385 [Terriglobia bacterium]